MFALAFLLALLSSTMLVFAVALVRTGGQRSQLQAAAYGFAVSAPGLMAGALVNAAVLSAVALVAARPQRDKHEPQHKEKQSIRARLRLGPTRVSPLGAFAAIAGMVSLNFAYSTACELLGVRTAGVMDALTQSLQTPSIGLFAAAILTIGVAPGFAEETFFRGFLQTRLVASWGRWPAIVVTAASFGLIHLNPFQGSLAFVAGLLLGWVVERTGGVRPAIVAHVTNNAIVVTLAMFGSGGQPSRAVQIAVLAAASAACVGAIVLLTSARAVTRQPSKPVAS